MTRQPNSPPPDQCPGVLATHQAADGAVARIRLPGGAITPAQLERLAQAAAEFGDGHLELTGRGNIQLRGVGDAIGVAAIIDEAGLLPSSAHDKVRNIEVSPLTGRLGGAGDLRPLAADLDERLRGHSRLSGLSGKFLFGLDDGRGDIMAQRPDVGVVLAAGEDGAAASADIVVDGVVVGASGLDEAADVLLAIADEFLTRSAGVWRIAGLPDEVRSELVGSARRMFGRRAARSVLPTPATEPEPLVGWFDQDDGAVLLGAVVESARVPSRLAEFIAAIGAPVIITPHREILICDLTEGVAETVVRVLAPMGLIFDANSPWTRVSSCVGAPGCAKSHADVRADLIAHVSDEQPTTREHWVGCARGCGTPTHDHLRVEATPEGYRSRRVS